VPIAADSFAFFVLVCPGRSLILERTFFIQLQNFSAWVLCFRVDLFAMVSFYFRTEMAAFEINRLSRVRDDLCGIEQYYKQSVGPGDYQVTNLVPDAKKVNPLSVDQLLIYPREGYGLNNRSIDADSILRNQPEFKNNRCIIRNQARPFATVPYMGGGRGNPDVESLLLHSEQVRQGKECGTVTEEFFDQQYTPLIQTVKENIQNPKNLVPEVAANGWIRGGIPSRSYIRDVNC
jgi:hypothetical protein